MNSNLLCLTSKSRGEYLIQGREVGCGQGGVIC